MLNKKIFLILLVLVTVLCFSSCDEEEVAYVTVDLSDAPHNILGVVFYNQDFIKGGFSDRIVFRDEILMGDKKTYEFNFHFIGHAEAVVTAAGFNSPPQGAGRIPMSVLSGDQWDGKLNVRPAKGGGGSHIVVRP